jgi:hypothetical protein
MDHPIATRGIAMAITLYNAPQSTCSQRVRFVLNAKQLAFKEEKLDLLAGDQLKPEYLALNPNGVVPTLDHDGAPPSSSNISTKSRRSRRISHPAMPSSAPRCAR